MTQFELRGGTAVAARRIEAADSLDLFPTPPWATRALVRHVMPVLGVRLAGKRIWEPACGLGHMSEVLKESLAHVDATDVYDHGALHFDGVHDFASDALPSDILSRYCRPNWVITNPPFNQAEKFLENAANVASEGVAFLVRTQFLESISRYELFGRFCPSLVAIFSERVPMVKGVWDPKASTATSYCWIVWTREGPDKSWDQPHLKGVIDNRSALRLMLIPPGCKQSLTRQDDKRLALLKSRQDTSNSGDLLHDLVD